MGQGSVGANRRTGSITGGRAALKELHVPVANEKRVRATLAADPQMRRLST